jgi:thioredoxin
MSETATPSTTAAAAPSKPRDVEETELAALLRPERLSVVDFSATWCGPCKKLEPIVHELAGDYVGRLKVVKVDVDLAPAVAARFGVLAVPTVLIVKDGSVRDQFSGVLSKRALSDRVDKVL